MKNLMIAVLVSLFGASAHADDLLLAKCGEYQILYRGSFQNWFSGIKVTTYDFLIDGGNGLISTVLRTDSEGGTLTGESARYDSQGQEIGKRTFIYDTHWGQISFKVLEDGQPPKTFSCVSFQ